VDNPLADKAAAAAALEHPTVPETPALLASSGSMASVNQEVRLRLIAFWSEECSEHAVI
jgi:hypothetical protein